MKTILPLLVIMCVIISAKSHAEVSANASITSNYIWRGETYTDDGPAIQGGLDWWNKQGVYAGVWLSNTDDGVDTDIEYDLYLGYEIELDAISLDLGVAYYELVDTDDADVTELYLGAKIEAFDAYHYIDSDNDTTYTSVGYEVSVSEYGIRIFAGSWGDTADGGHFGATLSRAYAEFDFSLTIENSDKDLEDDTLVYLMVTKNWDL